MRRVVVVAILWASTAHADDALTLRVHGEHTEPLLHLDSMFEPVIESPLATAQRIEAQFDLGRATTAVLANEHWIDSTTFARGMTVGLRVSHDFGFARLVASGSASQVESRFGSGTYLDLGVALMKTKRFSRWTTGWISLGLNYQGWVGQPGAAAGVMVWLGFTFR